MIFEQQNQKHFPVKILKNFMEKKIQQKLFEKKFSNFFFQISLYPKFFLKRNFLENVFDFVVQKSILTKNSFAVAEINLTSGVHCILVLFGHENWSISVFRKIGPHR